jgi:HTH-type transcriptional regulator/antitoxin HigA
MDIKPIKTEADYEAALKEIDHLMDAKPDTPEGDRLDVLTTLAEAWEESRRDSGFHNRRIKAVDGEDTLTH